jgi:adenosine/AMP kinase
MAGMTTLVEFLANQNQTDESERIYFIAMMKRNRQDNWVMVRKDCEDGDYNFPDVLKKISELSNVVSIHVDSRGKSGARIKGGSKLIEWSQNDEDASHSAIADLVGVITNSHNAMVTMTNNTLMQTSSMMKEVSNALGIAANAIKSVEDSLSNIVASERAERLVAQERVHHVVEEQHANELAQTVLAVQQAGNDRSDSEKVLDVANKALPLVVNIKKALSDRT